MSYNFSMIRIIPTSESQKRFFLEWAMDPNDNTYNISLVYLIKGSLNRKALKQACETFIQKHRIVHAYFSGDGNQCHYADYEINDFFSEEIIDITKDIETQLEEIVHKPFDLTKDILLKFYLLTNPTNHNEYYFIHYAHHIIGDATMADIFAKEITDSYNSYNQLINNPELLPPTEYKDTFEEAVKAENLLLTDTYREEARKFWLDFIGNIPLQVNLPYKTGIQPQQSGHSKLGKSIYFELNKNEREHLQAFVKKNKSTLFIILAAIYGLLVSKYSGQDKILLSYPTDTRLKDHKNASGCFINNLPLKIELDRYTSLEELIVSINKQRSEIKPFQHYSLTHIISDQRKYRHNDNTVENFNVIFSLTKLGSLPLNLEGVEVQSLNIPKKLNAMREFGFSYDASSPDKIKFKLMVQKSLFDENIIYSFKESFLSLVKSIEQNRIIHLKNFPLLNAEEYNKIVYEWNQIKEYPCDKTIHQLFEAQVEKTPNCIAAVCKGRSLTYFELNARANQLARHIQAVYQETYDRALSPDTLIALCMERSLELVIGILGILKAGAAYVPIDPHYPKQRINYLLKDSQAGLLVTQQALADQLNDLSSQAPLVFTEDSRHQSTDQLHVKTNAYDLAYVIYTSGTTGQPKGVLQTHSNVVRLFANTQGYYQFNDQDVWTLFHSFVFDFSVWELWGALFYGGKLIIPSYEETRDPSVFYQLCLQHQVTVLNQTPSAFYPFIEVANTSLSHLRYVIFGGEALNLHQLQSWWNRFEHQQPKLINMYGITETTVHVTFKELCSDHVQALSNIGKPLSDLQAYVLSAGLQPLPIGLPGELYIGGAGLARGYLNRPDLTAERFIPNPFATQADLDKGYSRIYKTGDLVRWLPEGDLEYIGRNDFQVKIRGHRIELNEIESVISQHPDVEQCVVVNSKNNKLAAYILFKSKTATSVFKVSDYLYEKLPNYMQPAHLVALDELPLTPNGKVDRKKLIDHKIISDTTKSLYPRNIEEFKMLNLFKEILKLKNLSIRDNFFRAGGDSLLSIQLITKLNKDLNINLKVSDLLHYPSVETLSGLVINKNPMKSSSLIQLQAGKETFPIICIHPGGGTAFCYMQLATALGEDVTVYGIQSVGVDNDEETPLKTIDAMVDHYIGSLNHLLDEKFILLGWSFGGLVAYEMARRLEESGKKPSHLILLDTPLPYKNLKIPYVSREDFIKKLIRFNELFPNITDEHINRYYRIYINNLLSIKSFVPKLYAGNVTLFQAEEEKETEIELPQAKNWQEIILGELVIKQMNCYHWNFMDKPHVNQLAEEIKKLSEFCS